MGVYDDAVDSDDFVSAMAEVTDEVLLEEIN